MTGEWEAPGPGKRARETRACTAQVLGWLWRRGHRVLATEVGYDSRGFGAATQRKARADVLGIRTMAAKGRTYCGVTLVEVKATAADFRGQDWGAEKWRLAMFGLGVQGWLAIGEGVDIKAAVAALDVRWGLLRIGPLRAEVLREPVNKLPLSGDDPFVVTATHEAGRALTAARMPVMMGKLASVVWRDIDKVLEGEEPEDFGGV